MGFADKKTRILDVILTNYGRYKFSLGELDIKYYAFSDDGIDYRAKKAGESLLSGSAAINEIKRITLCSEPTIINNEQEIKWLIFDGETETKPALKTSFDEITIEQKIKQISVNEAVINAARGVTGRVTFVAREHPPGLAIPVEEGEE